MMKAKISVVIPTHNSWKTLKNCLRSILNQSLRPTEIIVVNNASSDGTFENVKRNYSSVKLVKLSKNMGVTGGRNMGIKLASDKADYIFFFDHDMVAEKNMLEELVRVGQSDKEIGIVTPKIYYWEDKQSLRSGDRKKIWAAGTAINLWTGQVLFRGGKDYGQFEKTEEVQVAPAAMLVKKEVLDRVKRFDNRYFATYEDTDFCFRAKKIGFKIFYAPKAVAYHDLSTSKKDEAKRLLDRAYWVSRNRILFMKDFSKVYLIFLFFLPVYTLYYLALSIKYKRVDAGFNFLKGVLAGLFQ